MFVFKKYVTAVGMADGGRILSGILSQLVNCYIKKI
jgi:hypothetical protein